MARGIVYLCPGFFGFTSLGALTYFYGVKEALSEALEQRGVDLEVIETPTPPTSSIRRRADQLIDTVEKTGGFEADEVHFVGHSTGGLDIRLLTTPGVRIRPSEIEERLLARTRTVTTISTPHYGTPLAGFFTTLPGRQLLRLLAVMATTDPGRAGLFWASQAFGMLARADDVFGRTNTLLDTWADKLFSKMQRGPDDPIWEYMRQVAKDQGLILQLTPEAMHLFNSAVIDAPDVRYASFLTAAMPPPHALRAAFPRPLKTPLAAAFEILWWLGSRQPSQYPYPHPGVATLDPFRDELPFELTEQSNDGIVPSFSQIHGKVLGTVVADHLDVVGQYDRGDPLDRLAAVGFGLRRRGVRSRVEPRRRLDHRGHQQGLKAALTAATAASPTPAMSASRSTASPRRPDHDSLRLPGRHRHHPLPANKASSARPPTDQCHPRTWCESDQSAALDCAGLSHAPTTGQWRRDVFECVWQ